LNGADGFWRGVIKKMRRREPKIKKEKEKTM
jgi:hypothetical protein